MKKLTFILISVITLTVGFTSCKTEEPGENSNEWKIDAKVENGANYNATVDSVYAILSNETELAGKAKYENGGFKMNLMAVAPENLSTISEDMPDGITVSDKTAKITLIQLLYGIKNGNLVGLFLFTKYSQSDFMEEDADLDDGGVAMYIYANKNVKITGVDTETDTYDSQTYTYTTTYNLTLKAGWNRVVINVLENSEFYTKSEIVNLSNSNGYKWIFVPTNTQIPRVNIRIM